ncbi:MAG: (d)CMP kinase [Planctomycetes bacterium]|nr:(d)CMP kinase [Planctomycetota bacterium]MCB9868688.1 (d)CMP kinase [Planctomycetota bacterium]
MSDPDPAQLRRVVAIDGPSGSGKSTVARALAQALGFRYLDTGAMYRAVTWHLLRHEIPADLPDGDLAERLAVLRLQLADGDRVELDGDDVTAHLRSREVEARVSAVSARPPVRAMMRRLQRQIAAAGPVVAEGRDMGTVVFPAALWKFFLDAAPDERARRRCLDFTARGRDVTEQQVLEEIQVRDHLDSTRPDAPLRRADGAVYFDTTGRSAAEVVEQLARLVQQEEATGGSDPT